MVIRYGSIVRLLLSLAIFTTSFDVFLNYNIAGYSFRFTQIAILPIIMLYIFDIISEKRFKLPIGGNYLIMFCVIQFLFIFRAPNFINAVQYFLWLLFSVMVVLSIEHFCGKFFSFSWLIKVYLDSFFYMALFGLIQFILFPIGINLFVKQNWTPTLARINGLSYEPSYYATYMLLGFVIYTYLFIMRDNSFISHHSFKTTIICLTMILTSSRMGWMMMIIWVCIRIILFIHSLNTGLSKRSFLRSFTIIIIIAILSLILVNYIINNSSKIFFLLSGTGIAGSSAHSFDGRVKPTLIGIQIWLKSPLFGYGLGGIDAAICKYMNIPYVSSTMNGMASGLISQFFVGCGIIGGIPIILYFKKLISQSKKNGIIIKALAWALALELVNMLMSQGMLRAYLWMHIAVISCCVKSISSQDNNIIKKEKTHEAN